MQKNKFAKLLRWTVFDIENQDESVTNIETWRNKIYIIVASIMLLLGSPLFFLGAYMFNRHGMTTHAIAEIALAVIMGLIIVLRPIKLVIKKLVIVSFVYITGIALLIFAGPGGAGMPTVLFTFALSVSLLSKKQSFLLYIANLVVFAALSIGLFTGLFNGLPINEFGERWLINALSLQAFAFSLVYLFNRIIFGLDQQTMERQKSSALLAISEEKYRLLADNASDVIWLFNISKMKYEYLSPSIRQLTGFTPNERMTQPIQSSMSPESWVKVNARLLEIMPKFTQDPGLVITETLEVQMISKTRGPVWIEMSMTLKLNDKNEPVAIGVSRNIEERKAAEKEIRDITNALSQSDAALRRAQSVSHTGHWLVDVRKDMTICSDEACRICGVKPGVPISRDEYDQLVHPDDRDGYFAVRAETYENRSGYSTIHRIIADGQTKWVQLFADLDYADSGTMTSALITIQDITEIMETRRELEKYRDNLAAQVAERTQELEEARKIAEVSSRAKSTFLSNMSHEIRTPMNAIIGLARQLMNEPLAESQLDKLNKLSDSANHLLQIINDILDISKIEADQIELSSQNFEPAREIDYICNLVADAMAAKKLSLSIDLSQIPPVLKGDNLRFRQIFINLINNAVKFTNKGGINITGTMLSEDRDSVQLRFDVRDSGIGMTKEQAARVFDEFKQADDSITRAYGGTGLGLTISKRLAELLGGHIGVESEPGIGSTFWVEIPILKADMPADTHEVKRMTERPIASTEADIAAAIDHIKGARVLLVEDNPINLEVGLYLEATAKPAKYCE